MNIDTLNPYVIRILISARDYDSISSISGRIGLSYGWTHKWVSELIREGVFMDKWRGLILQKNNSSYKKMLKFIKSAVSPVNLYYSVLPLLGIEYSFTKTDAVYFWTEGRYNIARYRDFYPIFIKVKADDYKLFEWYCRKLKLKINSKSGVFYSPEIVEDFKHARKNDYFVDPLDETIGFMKKNIYNFEPALEMIEEIYHKKLGYKYKEMNML